MASQDLGSMTAGAATASPEASASALGSLAPGKVWQGRYLVEQELPASGGGRVFAGVRQQDGVPVRLRRLAESADSETRREVWAALSDPPLPGGPVLLESVIEDDGRVEVWQPVEGPTLEERLSTAKLVTDDVAELVRPLAKALAALHERDLVYLQLSAERVVLSDSAMGDARLTRVELSTKVAADGNLVPVPTDVTRVPPEGLGLYRMKADDGLKAWDWWTLGRLIQELWLGHTVMAHALGRDLPRSNDYVRRHAEQMLKEENAKDPRAGGVEHMTDLPVQVRVLLRGLLTSVRDARWGAKEVMAWLEGDAPFERYDLPRSTVLIKFHGEQLTVADTARRLLTPEHWREGVAMWVAEKPPAGSLLEVLGKTRSALHHERDWLEEVQALETANGFKSLPAEYRDEILSALAWTGIAGKGTRYRWRGQIVDADLAAAVLAEDDGVERLAALLDRATIAAVKRVDANTSWQLDTWARQIEEVKALATKHEWLKDTPETRARLIGLALTDVAELDRRFAEARIKYKIATEEAVQAMFGSVNPSNAMLALLALSFEHAEACGYLTHEEWRAHELARLRARGERLAEALLLVDVLRWLRIGQPVFGPRWVWAFSFGLVLGATALFWPGWEGLETIAALGAGLLVLRRLLRGVVRENCRMDPEEAWSWDAAFAACSKHARLALDGGSLDKAQRLRKRLAGVNREMLKLGGEPAPELVQEQSMDERIRMAAIGSWVLVILLMTGISWQTTRPEWSVSWAGGEWEREITVLLVKFGLMEEPEPEIEVIQIAWPHGQADAEARGVTYEERDVPTPSQVAKAEAFLAEVQRLYLPETLSGIVAIDVSEEGVGGAELILIDVVAGKLFNGLIYEMNYVPLRGTWMKMANRDVLFLDRP